MLTPREKSECFYELLKRIAEGVIPKGRKASELDVESYNFDEIYDEYRVEIDQIDNSFIDFVTYADGIAVCFNIGWSADYEETSTTIIHVYFDQNDRIPEKPGRDQIEVQDEGVLEVVMKLLIDGKFDRYLDWMMKYFTKNYDMNFEWFDSEEISLADLFEKRK
jgi:hypothetical protein